MKLCLPRLIFSALCVTMASASAGQLASLSIIDQQSGTPIRIWRHAGQNYVAGQPGQRYTLQVTNKTGGRLLAVMAVDGINVITGATASGNQSGYVLYPGQAADIAGWRKNMQEVAAFYFTQVSDSYAARTGRADQAGVIGVALYREQVVEVSPFAQAAPGNGVRSENSHRHAKSAAGSAAPAAQAEQKLGTGHGERIDSATSMTDFKRASSSPAEVLTVYYDSYANLVARGIIPSNHSYPIQPNPFPGGFVPDPQ